MQTGIIILSNTRQHVLKLRCFSALNAQALSSQVDPGWISRKIIFWKKRKRLKGIPAILIFFVVIVVVWSVLVELPISVIKKFYL